jgi:hypothetical protein
MKITLEHDGVTYAGQVGTITATSLGLEDHGVMTTQLIFEGVGWGVGFGGMCLDEFDKAEDRRVGSAFGLDHIMELLRVVGVSSWEKIKGKQMVVLYKDESFWGSSPVGIASLEGDRVFIPKAHAESWLEKVGA